ncbi:hypothetical protein IscW_ISCW018798 [Ixodes scapularis]|uniref:Uncharacterized protein n=1 Tax=Ixodes scapularis TaxID=6945 RepID=B7PQY9_IXOSC|nr:hypothetical protein IscW_ISCW018798 [Ixodes scapularis]|eukprot:XP_002436181.1 hypothetical protein IscW_ISCW018798 [Ixodes scapularis]
MPPIRRIVPLSDLLCTFAVGRSISVVVTFTCHSLASVVKKKLFGYYYIYLLAFIYTVAKTMVVSST